MSWLEDVWGAGLTSAATGLLRGIYGTHIYDPMLTDDLKKGSAEFLILSLLRHEPRHGYELSKLIEARSNGVVQFHVSSLYPLLYRMEQRGWIVGRWVEKAGQRRRRYYDITPAGREIVEAQCESWLEFVRAISLVAGVTHA
jgi:PadR family transcriptional regulator PadR